MSAIFVDGNVNYPSCKCGNECEMPCWQLDGLTDQPCGACGCAPFDYKPVVVAAAVTSSVAESPERREP